MHRLDVLIIGQAVLKHARVKDISFEMCRAGSFAYNYLSGKDQTEDNMKLSFTLEAIAGPDPFLVKVGC